MSAGADDIKHARFDRAKLATWLRQSPPDDPVALVIIILAILSTLLTLVYTFLTGIRIFFGPLKPLDNMAHVTDPPMAQRSLPVT